MAHLLKLELKKFGLARNIVFSFIAILFSIAFMTVSLLDSMTDPEQTKDTFESMFVVTGLLMSFIFLVYSAVLTARLVVGEYSQKTITILFSYPVNRNRLIVSKLVLIMLFTALSMGAGYLLCCGYLTAVDGMFDMLAGNFTPSLLQSWIPAAASSIVVCMILSVWPFIIGMIRKSGPMTIVTSLFVILLRQIVITKNPTNQESLVQIILLAVVTLAFTVITFRKKVPQLY